MINKERVKEEIDQMPEELVEEVFAFINDLQKKKKGKKEIRAHKLKGVFDHNHIRKRAYE